MIINFRVRGISRVMHKLVQTSILIKKNIKRNNICNGTVEFVRNYNLHLPT
jgi:hypothetical protein